MIWIGISISIVSLSAIYGVWLYFFIHGRTQVLSAKKYEVEKRVFSIIVGGNTIWGELLVPKIGGKFPIVICSHGFGANYKVTETLIGKTFAKSGIACYCFDFYGGSNKSKSGGKMQEMSVLTEKGELLEVVKAIRNLEFVDKDRVFLFGESQGALVTAVAAAEIEREICGLILYYPAFSIPELAKKICKNGVPSKYKIFNKTVSGKYYADACTIDIYGIIKDFSKPVLIVHGNHDNRINIDFGKRAASTYPNAEFIELNKEYHGFSGKGKMKAVRYAYEFICKYQIEEQNNDNKL